MDLDLPILDIVEDIEEIMDDDGVLSPEDFEEALRIEEEKKQPFVLRRAEPPKTPTATEGGLGVTPKKKKKELSEKQLMHLNKIRGMALEKRQTKAAAKKEAIDKVKEDISSEHKPKYYKPKAKKTKEEKEEEKLIKKKYKEKTIEVNEEIVDEEEHTTPDEFIPKHKAAVKEKKEAALFNQQDSFNHFMGNMESYLKMREEHDRTRRAPPAISRASKTTAVKETPKKQPVSQPTDILQPINDNPFSSYFG